MGKGEHFSVASFYFSFFPPRLIVLHVGPITLCSGPYGHMSLTLETSSLRKWNHMF